MLGAILKRLPGALKSRGQTALGRSHNDRLNMGAKEVVRR